MESEFGMYPEVISDHACSNGLSAEYAKVILPGSKGWKDVCLTSSQVAL